MKERPILMNGPMVRATLSDAKTQTRRLDKRGIEGPFLVAGDDEPRYRIGNSEPLTMGMLLKYCPFGQPGDRLWVRESFADMTGTGIEHRDDSGKLRRYAYMADTKPGSYSDESRKDYGIKWTPSIHMPRHASRIMLEIASVRLAFLHEISTADIIAEGLITTLRGHDAECDLHDQWQALWKSTGGDWDSDPRLWVISFRRVPA